MVSLCLLSLVALGFVLGAPSLSYSSCNINNLHDVDRHEVYTTSSTPVGDVIQGDSVIAGDSVVSVPGVVSYPCSLYVTHWVDSSVDKFSFVPVFPFAYETVSTSGSREFVFSTSNYPYSVINFSSNPVIAPVVDGVHVPCVPWDDGNYHFIYVGPYDNGVYNFSFTNSPYVSDSVVGSVGEGLGLVGHLGSALNEGFGRIFYDGSELTDVGKFSFVLFGLGISVSLIGLCFRWFTGKKVS